jgi:hypothetical protein
MVAFKILMFFGVLPGIEIQHKRITWETANKTGYTLWNWSVTVLNITIKDEGEGKFHPRTGHEGPEGE